MAAGRNVSTSKFTQRFDIYDILYMYAQGYR